MAVGGGGASVPRLGPRKEATAPVGRRGLQAAPVTLLGPLPMGRGVVLPVGACFRCRKVSHWKNECPNAPGIVARGCYTCGLGGHISRFCPRRAGARAEPEGGVKGKERAPHGPEEKQMGPNERGWQERNWLAQVNAIGFDYSKSVEETIRRKSGADGPTGART